MNVKEKQLEKNENLNKQPLEADIKEDLVTTSSKDFVITNEKVNKKSSIFTTLIFIFISILVISFGIFTAYNFLNTNIVSGVSIKSIDVSNMSKSDARYQVDNYINEILPEEIKLVYGDFETTISLSQIDASFDTKEAADIAYRVGRQGNIFQNNLYVLSTLLVTSTDREPPDTFIVESTYTAD